jgi:hypothetical protein
MKRGLAASALLWILSNSAAWAADVVKPPRPPNFARYAYHYELLDKVLEKTIEEFGPYTHEPYTEAMTTARLVREAVRGELINVVALDIGNDTANHDMIPIPDPIDKGLLGLRVALIVQENAAKIDALDSLEKLRSVTVGRGSDWGDVRIFEYNRVPLVTSPHYEPLFEMLSRGRFDLFPRGVTEAPQELVMFRERHPNLAIARHLLIRYPYAQFFYVSKTEPRLAERLKLGLGKMRRDGSFDAHFGKHFAAPLAELRLAERIVIELDNPFIPSWVPIERKELWFDVRKTN